MEFPVDLTDSSRRMNTEDSQGVWKPEVAEGSAEGQEPRVRAILYAAKSTVDSRGSIRTQLDDARTAAEAQRRLVSAEYQDERVSAYTRNRGAGLATAVAAAVAAARDGGEVELWVQHSDRLARGSGRKAGARHLGKLYFDLQAEGVQLRSVEDDENLRDAIRAVLIGERNHEDSRRKGLAVAAGRRRARDRGEWTGGRTPEGYRKLERREGEARRLGLDPDRAPIVRRILELGLSGLTPGEVARELNVTAVPARIVRRGGFELGVWTAERILRLWRLPHYAGFITHRGEVVREAREEAWPRLITPARWHRLQRVIAARANEVPGKAGSKRRISKISLLAQLGRCGLCGGSIRAITNRPKVDGTYTRRYQCSRSVEATGCCQAPRIDPDQIEQPFLRQLDGLALDLTGWLNNQLREFDAIQERTREKIAECERRLAALASELVQVRSDYRRQLVSGSSGAANVAAFAIETIDLEQHETHGELTILQESLALAEDTRPDPAALAGLCSQVQSAVLGHVVGDSVAELNARLKEVLAYVEITPMDDGAVCMQAVLSEGFLAAIGAEPEAAVAQSTADPNPAEQNQCPSPPALKACPPFQAVRVQAARIRQVADHEARQILRTLKKDAVPGRELGTLPSGPGLYAIRLSPRSAIPGIPEPKFGLLFVGSTRDLAARKLSRDFASGKTSSSFLRRSVGALLRDELQLQPVPRDPCRPRRRRTNPAHRYRSLQSAPFVNYRFDDDGEERLSRWMQENLRVGIYPIPRPAATSFDLVEIACPPLNLRSKNPLGATVRSAHKTCVEAAREAAASSRVGQIKDSLIPIGGPHLLSL